MKFKWDKFSLIAKLSNFSLMAGGGGESHMQNNFSLRPD